MKIALYNRVSTRDQTTENQKIRLVEYAKSEGKEFDVWRIYMRLMSLVMILTLGFSINVIGVSAKVNFTPISGECEALEYSGEKEIFVEGNWLRIPTKDSNRLSLKKLMSKN